MDPQPRRWQSRTRAGSRPRGSDPVTLHSSEVLCHSAIRQILLASCCGWHYSRHWYYTWGQNKQSCPMELTADLAWGLRPPTTRL